ncbi:MAG: hypothetical protein M1835_005362 [Candelina submexicana]|nr:MAG: hypothetical protein M1835_005362 [Candelina submexicana]
MAALVKSCYTDQRESVWHQSKTQQFFKTGVDDCRGFDGRTLEIVVHHADQTEKTWCWREAQSNNDEQAPSMKSHVSGNIITKFEPVHPSKASLSPYDAPPPSYDEAITDEPPDYSGTEALAHAHLIHKTSKSPSFQDAGYQQLQSPIFEDPTVLPSIDFFAPSSIRTHANKKAKQAAKKAQQAKWDDSGDEGDKNEGEGGDGGGANGGGGGGSNNGDGGAGDGDGDGDEWDYGNKKGKKGKKGKAAAEEEEKRKKEEEEKKKKEEEEKRKKKDDEAAFVGGWGNTPGDAGGDANAEDEWSGFQTGKKGKKGKKGKAADPIVPKPAGVAAEVPSFDDIDLDGGDVPQIDLNFGNANTKTSTGGGFGGFSGFGSTWDAGNKWDFGAVDATTTGESITEGTNAWSFNKKEKNKKDQDMKFDFDNFGLAAQVDSLTAEEPPRDDDAFSGPAVSKKDKKKGKKGTTIEEQLKGEPPVVAEPEPEVAAEDEWGGWGKSTKKKGKKGGITEIGTAKDMPPPPPPAPEKPSTEPSDPWDSFSTKKDKDKKKGKKGANEDPAITVVPETTTNADDTCSSSFGKKDKDKKGKKFGSDEPVVVESLETSSVADDIWGSFGKNKDKKGKKDATKESNLGFEASILDTPDTQTQPTADDTWSFSNFPQKDKKGKKKGFDEVKDDGMTTMNPSNAAAAATSEATDNFMNWDTGKKGKKNKKATVADTKLGKVPPPPPPPNVPDVLEDIEATGDWGDNAWGGSSQKAKKDDKKDDKQDTKAKKGKDAEPDFDTEFLDSTDPVMKPDGIDEPKVEEDDWGVHTWSTSAKDRKKKASKKNTPVEVVEETSNAFSMQPDSIVEPKPAAVEETWNAFGSKNDKKKKGGKKGVLESAPPPAPTPPNMGLTPEPIPAPSALQNLDEVGDDGWGSSLGPSRTTKGKKDLKKGSSSKETSTAKVIKVEDAKLAKKGAEESPDDIMDIIDDSIADDFSTKTTTEPKEEETPAKAAKGFWGSYGLGSASTKPKTTKETEKERKEKQKKEKEEREAEAEKARKEEAAREAEWNALVDVPDEPAPKKGSKAKFGGILTKVDSKTSKVSNASDKTSEKLADKAANKTRDDFSKLINIVAEEPSAETNDNKSKISDSKVKKDEKKNDSWGIWGAKKTTPAKSDDSKKGKESLKDDSATQASPLDQFDWNDPEPAAEEPPAPIKTTSTKKTTSVKPKTGGIADKIKAFEKKEDSGKSKKTEVIAVPPPPPPAPVPEIKVKEESPPANKASNSSKSKALAATKAAAKKKESSPETVELKKNPTPPPAAVPGSFPSEGADDDVLAVTDPAPAEKKTNKRDNNKKGLKGAKMDPVVVETPPPAPPTSPPEPEAAKPVKKERARVVRDAGASSWGFWGAAPKSREVKKDRNVKDDAPGISSPAKEKTTAPGLSRSKSTRKATEKEVDSAKSSGSDKPARPDAKPTKSRGMSFTQFFAGGAPPSRSKSVRQASAPAKINSRRQSLDIDTGGILTPPRDDQLKKPQVSTKAAKVMGVTLARGSLGRKQSTNGKQEARDFTDPYALDDDILTVESDDDLVDVSSPPAEEVISKAVRSTRGTNGRSNKEVKKVVEPSSSGADDLVMVDAPGLSTSGPEDIAAVETPRASPMKRSTSSAKKPDSKLMGLFGSFRSKPRRQSEGDSRGAARAVYASEDATHRKKKASEDDSARRMRRDGRDFRSSDRSDPTAASTEVEDEEARRAERRARRKEHEAATRETREAEIRSAKERQARKLEAERAEVEARKARAREARQRREREEEEREAKKQEEKRSRRAAREERLARDEQALREAEAREAERRQQRRTRRRENEPQLARAATMSDERPRTGKSDRRRSYAEKPAATRNSNEDVERRKRHDERRARRTLNERSSRRKSAPVPAPVADYFDPRNAAHAQEAEPFAAVAPLPYMVNGPTDHTSSWVNSQIIEPPPPPPIEPTVIEAPEEPALDTRGAPVNERRRSRHSGRSTEKDEHRRSRRHSRRQPLSSEEDQYAARDNGYVYANGYANGGAKTFDGKAAVIGPGAKLTKGSWWNKIAGYR